jgi:hypothetical protein
MPEALKHTLAALAKLSSADRNAILRQLSPEERAAIAKRSAPRPPALAASKPALPVCSPWLAKRVAQLMQQRDASITSATHAALREVHFEPAR